MAPIRRPSRGKMSDEQLIEQMRGGDQHAYGELWNRHYRAGLTAARSFGHLDDPEDLVAEAFTRIFRALQEGTGPRSSFRPYLYTTIRNLAVRNVRNLAAVTDVDLDTIPEPSTEDAAIEKALDQSLTATAFRALPERWQSVLWYTEVERMNPAQAGKLLGLTANATSALAFRARAALRTAWLQAHVNDDTLADDCREALKHIGEYAQGTLGRREEQRVEEHLRTCTRCSIITDEVDHVAGRLAIIMLPLVLGGAAALAFGHSIATGSVVAGGAPVPAAPAIVPVVQAATASLSGLSIAGIVVGGLAILGVGSGVTIALTNAPAPQTSESVGELPSSTAPATTDAATPVLPPLTPLRPTTPPPTTIPEPPQKPTTRPGPQGPKEPTAVLPQLDAPLVNGGVLADLTNQTSATVSGTGTPGATIAVSGAADTSVTVAADGTWQWSGSHLAEGANSLAFAQRGTGYRDSAATTFVVTVDTIAPAAPTVAHTWTNAQLTAPSFSGTGEPFAVVTLVDPHGAKIATTTADAAGTWSTAGVTGLSPATGSLTAVQTDPAGNGSTGTTVGPFAFVPTVEVPPSPQASGLVPLTVTGWANAPVLASVNGNTPSAFQLDGSGVIHLTAMSSTGSPLVPGTYTATIRYGTASTSSAAAVTVTFTVP